MRDVPASTPDSAVERTRFAWERTAISVLAIAMLLLFKTKNPLEPMRHVLVVLTVLVAVTIHTIARSRGRLELRTNADGRRVVRAPDTAARLVAWGTVGLAATIVIAMLDLDR
jgi:uncharacterized membrane protein YidH (DUF202 family)